MRKAVRHAAGTIKPRQACYLPDQLFRVLHLAPTLAYNAYDPPPPSAEVGDREARLPRGRYYPYRAIPTICRHLLLHRGCRSLCMHRYILPLPLCLTKSHLPNKGSLLYRSRCKGPLLASHSLYIRPPPRSTYRPACASGTAVPSPANGPTSGSNNLSPPTTYRFSHRNLPSSLHLRRCPSACHTRIVILPAPRASAGHKAPNAAHHHHPPQRAPREKTTVAALH